MGMNHLTNQKNAKRLIHAAPDTAFPPNNFKKRVGR